LRQRAKVKGAKQKKVGQGTNRQVGGKGFGAMSIYRRKRERIAA